MLGFARWLPASGDIETSTRILDEVLLLEPAQPEALQMLRELGYAVPTEEGAYAEGQPEGYAERGEPPGETGISAPYDPSAPLPSYDLEEVSADEALRGGPRSPPSLRAEPARRSFRRGAAAQLPDGGARGPRDDRDSAEIAVPKPASPRPRSQRRPAPRRRRGGRRSRRRSLGQLDEEALEEVEFFASNRMFDEARNLLEEQLGRMPNHPLLIERLRELQEHAAAVQGDASGTRAVPRDAAPAFGGMPGSSPFEDRSFDIAASLDALDALDAGPADTGQREGNQVSVESVFEQFKAGVAASISESDAATHYDLGVAYKEMGLVTDAITEFQLAAAIPGASACATG